MIRSAVHIQSKSAQHEAIERWRAGDREAGDELVRGVWLMVVKHAKHAWQRFPKLLTMEECLAAGLDGVLRSMDKFDGQYNTKFSSYADRGIRLAIRAAQEKERRYQARYTTSCGNGVLLMSPSPEPDREMELTEEHERIEQAFLALPFRERHVLGRVRLGWTLDRIGAEMGICKERVRQLRERACEWMRDSLGIENPLE